MRGNVTKFLAIMLTWTGLLLVAAPLANADTPFTLDLSLDVRDDGSLQVTQTTTVPDGGSASSAMPLQIQVEGNRTQHFTVSDISTEDGAQAIVDGDTLSMTVPSGTSTVRYTVAGTVSDGPDLQQFTWLLAAAWSQPISTLTGSFSSPAAAPDSPICAYGQIGIRRLCSLTQTELGGQVTFAHNNLTAGDVVVFSVLLPADTVPATADFSTTVGGEDTGFAATGSDRAGLIAVTAATVLAAAAVAVGWWRRRNDQAAAASGTDVPNLFTGDGGGFSSPDGVLPGQVGVVLTGTPRATDFSATVLDLAVRNYLWLAETPREGRDPDFQISRRADLDGAVTVYERATVEALLPAGLQSVLLSELTADRYPVDLVTVDAAVARSLADRGWIRNQNTAQSIGFALLGVGAAATLVLYVIGVSPLFGVTAAILGAGITAAGLLLPRRTGRGSRLAAALRGMSRHVVNTDPATVDSAVAPVLFERALPYAHAVGQLQLWLARWSDTGPQQLGWYQPAAGSEPALAGLPVLAAALDALAAQSQAGEWR